VSERTHTPVARAISVAQQGDFSGLADEGVRSPRSSTGAGTAFLAAQLFPEGFLKNRGSLTAKLARPSNGCQINASTGGASGAHIPQEIVVQPGTLSRVSAAPREKRTPSSASPGKIPC